jgi:D-tyrosyl-tRNA(Tyr) deacylase
MRAVIQRVSRAKVTTNNKEEYIGKGLLILVGIEQGDSKVEADWMLNKWLRLRVFNDEEGKMNKSLSDVDGELMVISQFTLYGDARKGTRPSYIQAARPEHAIPLYEYILEQLSLNYPKKVASGEFGAHMDVELVNDGPVTLILDKENSTKDK